MQRAALAAAICAILGINAHAQDELPVPVEPVAVPSDTLETAPEEQAASPSNAADAEEDLELISVDRMRGDDAPENIDEFEDEQASAPNQRQSNLEELRRSYELYQEALSIGSLDEADTLAKRMVELAIRVYGLDSHESAKALTNLGLVQQKNNDYESAILNFEASIDIIERIEDMLNGELISPLRGLGSAQLGAGRPDLARRSYDRAKHISHVNEGPHNLMQVDILEELAEVYLAMGEREEALDMHQFIYNLEARNTDLKSQAIIPTLERQAEWLNRMRLFEKERMTHRRIIRILEDEYGRSDVRLIKPLTGLGKSYMFVSEFDAEYYGETSVASGDTYLKRALRIAEESPDADWQQLTETMLSLADFYVMTERAAKAKTLYRDTWELLSEDPSRSTARAELLEKPFLLSPINPPKYYDSDRPDDGTAPPDSFETGTIVVGYRINSRGAARDIEVLSADPSGLDDMEYSVSREVRRIIHRPQMLDGEVIDAPGQTYRHEFYYRPSDLPVIEDDAVAAGEPGNGR